MRIVPVPDSAENPGGRRTPSHGNSSYEFSTELCQYSLVCREMKWYWYPMVPRREAPVSSKTTPARGQRLVKPESGFFGLWPGSVGVPGKSASSRGGAAGGYRPGDRRAQGAGGLRTQPGLHPWLLYTASAESHELPSRVPVPCPRLAPNV